MSQQMSQVRKSSSAFGHFVPITPDVELSVWRSCRGVPQVVFAASENVRAEIHGGSTQSARPHLSFPVPVGMTVVFTEGGDGKKKIAKVFLERVGRHKFTVAVSAVS